MIGIIYAMEEEFKKVIEVIKIKFLESISNMDFKIGEIFGKECIIVSSGVGKVHAAMCSQTMVLKYNPDLIINIGTAGAIDDRMGILDLVVAKNVVQYDYDISIFDDKVKGQISGINISEIPCDEELSELFLSSARSINKKVYFGNLLTGDKFIYNKKELINLREEFKGLACEMECGAIGQVCYINNVKFAALKVISDKADKSSKVNFEEYMDKSSQIIYDILKQIFIKI